MSQFEHIPRPHLMAERVSTSAGPSGRLAEVARSPQSEVSAAVSMPLHKPSLADTLTQKLHDAPCEVQNFQLDIARGADIARFQEAFHLAAVERGVFVNGLGLTILISRDEYNDEMRTSLIQTFLSAMTPAASDSVALPKEAFTMDNQEYVFKKRLGGRLWVTNTVTQEIKVFPESILGSIMPESPLSSNCQEAAKDQMIQDILDHLSKYTLFSQMIDEDMPDVTTTNNYFNAMTELLLKYNRTLEFNFSQSVVDTVRLALSRIGLNTHDNDQNLSKVLQSAYASASRLKVIPALVAVFNNMYVSPNSSVIDSERLMLQKLDEYRRLYGFENFAERLFLGSMIFDFKNCFRAYPETPGLLDVLDKFERCEMVSIPSFFKEMELSIKEVHGHMLKDYGNNYQNDSGTTPEHVVELAEVARFNTATMANTCFRVFKNARPEKQIWQLKRASHSAKLAAARQARGPTKRPSSQAKNVCAAQKTRSRAQSHNVIFKDAFVLDHECRSPTLTAADHDFRHKYWKGTLTNKEIELATAKGWFHSGGFLYKRDKTYQNAVTAYAKLHPNAGRAVAHATAILNCPSTTPSSYVPDSSSHNRPRKRPRLSSEGDLMPGGHTPRVPERV